MKKSLIICLCIAGSASAHDHVEVGRSGPSSAQLALDGPFQQVACFVPRGEFFSGYLPNFPGGWHASELTFTTEVNALDSADGANPRMELVSVSGPAGGSFAFWEVGATSPTWSRAVGWNSGQGNVPGFPVVFNGDGHAHGRAFTMDRPGNYTVVLRAVDSAGLFSASANYRVAFRAQQPPQLSIGISGGNASLSFTSRANLTYELQTRTNLSSGTWDLVSTNAIDGDGTVKETVLPLSHPRAFFRLVEFK